MALVNAPVKPSIKIFVPQGDHLTEKIREIQAGIEEEGVPWVTEDQESSDALMLSYRAAAASSLGVGIGVNSDEICIHIINCRRKTPFFPLRMEEDRLGVAAGIMPPV